jgi:hypothetical protein
MTLVKRQPQPFVKRLRSDFGSWWDKGIALLALANLILVLFDISYIHFRDFWLQGRVQLFIKLGAIEREFPTTPIRILPFRLTDWYDWVKGIEPNEETEQYLQLVEELDRNFDKAVLNPTQQQQEIININLQQLRERSIELIDTNPFQVANKTGTLERIKNKMRRHVFGTTKNVSAKEAFAQFWNSDRLSRSGYRQELEFFDREIRPLMKTNYFRPVGENGEPVDNFGLLDFPFFLIFGLDFLVRTFLISRRRTGVSWFDAMLWRWYDIFLLIPLLRWMRVLPVTIRLHQAKLIDLHTIKQQASQGFVASIAEDVTEVVVIQIVNQLQSSIRRGDVGNLLSRRNVREYIDLNQVNETTEIIKLTINTLVYQVLPKIRPDIEAIIHYNIEKVVERSPAYKNIRLLPGMESLQTNFTQQLTKQIYQGFWETITVILKEDPAFDRLLERLVANLGQTISSELKTDRSIDRIESLLVDLLEEIKINYIQRLSQEDVEKILEQKRTIRVGAGLAKTF